MRLKSLFLFASVAVLVSCGNSGKGSGDTAMADGQAAGNSETENSQDLSGVYKGTMPAADCPGIEVRITLNGDSTFESCNKYIERDEFHEEGNYSIEGNILTMVTDDGSDTAYYKMYDDCIVMLDRDKKEIDSPFAEMYRLRKMDYGESLHWDKYSFDVDIYGDTLTITPHGLTIDSGSMKHDIGGYSFAGAETGDINGDHYPEIFVYLISDGSGSYGKLICYSTRGGKSMSRVALPSITDDSRINKGYMGHEEMSFSDSVFTVRFSIYNDGDSNAEPTGGTRQVQYRMADGVDGLVLKVDKVTEY